MSNTTFTISSDLYNYLTTVSLREPAILEKLRLETSKQEHANMQIAPEQGQFMQLLVKLIGAKHILEVGVFTGYSALSMALALPEDGKIIGCDVSEAWTSIARKYWAEAGMGHKIDLRLAPAEETLKDLLDKDFEQHFDMAFIDADKANYNMYYELTLQLLKPGGLMLIDNTLWSGKVADPNIEDPDTNSIRTLNLKLLNPSCGFCHKSR